MSDAPARLSPLAGHVAAGLFDTPEGATPGVELAERRPLDIVHLATPAASARAVATAVKGALGLVLPTVPNTGATADGVTALWVGPERWLIVAPDRTAESLLDRLEPALARTTAALTDQGHGRVCIRIAGPRARDVLAKACGLDLHPRAFAIGACAQTEVAHVNGLVHLVNGAPTFDVYVARSFGLHAWEVFADAAREYGYRVVDGSAA